MRSDEILVAIHFIKGAISRMNSKVEHFSIINVSRHKHSKDLIRAKFSKMPLFT